MKIGIFGAGSVGAALGTAWARKGHQVFFGVPHPQDTKSQGLVKSIGRNAATGTFAQAAAASEVVVLATPWPAVPDALRDAGNLDGKILIDCTNPLSSDFTCLAMGHTTSSAEQISQWATGAKVFKAFNQTGFNNMENPEYAGQRSVMFICGDDQAARPVLLKLVSDVGFDAIDAGALVIARLLEPLAMLWIHLANAQGLGRNFAFGILRRDR